MKHGARAKPLLRASCDVVVVALDLLVFVVAFGSSCPSPRRGKGQELSRHPKCFKILKVDVIDGCRFFQ